MASIDERIVQMRFDNKQFESNVKNTMGSLDRLKQSLNMDSAAKQFSKIDQMAKNVSFDSIVKNLDYLAGRFSTFGIAGMTVIQDLTNSAINAGKQITSTLTNAIVSGGKRRALNIEQAKFQIEGLGYAWEDVEGDISYGVKDTAYGLDAAAKAASQLLASQVNVGDEMKTALRAISGVASMTSSEYDDIARVFTTVAGNGKVMGDQLMQLSTRGLNAAATLGDALGKTEAEVRDMVSKGQIDFATFAKAMDDAFGSHAKEANKVFTGALSNMKAALSRIGANFATPAYQNLRDVINSLTPVIDDVNKALTPLIELFSDGAASVAKFTSELLGNLNVGEHLADPFAKIKTIILNLVEASKNSVESIESFFKPIRNVFDGSYSAFSDYLVTLSNNLVETTSNFTNFSSNFERAGKTIFNVLNSVKSIAKTVFDSIGIGVQSFSDSMSDISELGDGFHDFSSLVNEELSKIESYLSESEIFSENLKTFFDGLFSSFSVGISTIDSINGSMTNFLKKVNEDEEFNLGNQIESFSGVLADVGTKMSSFTDSVDSTIEVALTNLADSFGRVFLMIIPSAISSFTDSFSGISSIFENLSITFGIFSKEIDNITSTLSETITTSTSIKGIFDGLFSVIGLGVTFVSSLTSSFNELIKISRIGNDFKISDVINDLVQTLGKTFSYISIYIDLLGSKISTAFGEIANFIGKILAKVLPNAADAFTNSFHKMDSAVNNVMKAFVLIIEHVSNFISYITQSEKIIDSISNVFSVVFSVLKLGATILEAVSSAFLTFFQTLTKESDTNVGSTVENIFEVIGNAASSLSSFIESLIPKIESLSESFNDMIRESGLVHGVVTILSGSFAKMVDIIKNIQSFFGDLLSSFGGSTSVFSKLGSVFSDVLKSMMTNFQDFIKNLTFDDVMNAFNTAFNGIMAIFTVKGALDFKKFLDGLKGVGDNIEKAVKTFTGPLDSIAEAIKSFKEKSKPDELRNIAVSIAILAGSLFLLSTIDPEALVRSVGALAALFAGLYKSLEYLKTIDMTGLNTGALIGISAALLLLSFAVSKLAKIDSEDFSKGLVGVGILLLEIAGFMELTNDIQLGKMTGLIAIGIALVILGSAVDKLGSMDTNAAIQGIVAIGFILGELAAFTKIADGTKGILTASIGMIAIATSMVILSNAIEKFGSMDLESLGKGLIAMGIGLAEMIAAMKLLPKDTLSKSVGLIVLATAILIMSNALTSFGSMSIEGIAKSLIVLGGSLFIIVAALNLVKTAIPGAIAITIIAGALSILAPVLMLFGSMSLEQIAKSLGMLAGIFIVFGAAGAILGPLVPTLFALSGALALFGVGVLAAGTGVSLLSAALIALAGAGMGVLGLLDGLLSTVIGWIPMIFAGLAEGIIAFLKMIGDAAGGFVLTIRDILFTLGTALLGLIIDLAPQFGEAVLTLLNTLISVVTELIPQMTALGISIALAFLEAVGSIAPKLIEVGVKLLVSLLEGIRDNIQTLTTTAGEIAVNFINGLAEVLPDIIEAGANLMLSFLLGMKESVEDHGSEIVQAALDLVGTLASEIIRGIWAGLGDLWNIGASLFQDFLDGILSIPIVSEITGTIQAGYDAVTGFIGKFFGLGENCAQGFVGGLGSLADKVVTTASNMAQTALDAIQSTIDSNSPSKETEKLGIYTGQGLIVGMNKMGSKVSRSGTDLASRLLGGTKEALSNVNAMFDSDLDLNPIITPVIDASQVKRGIGLLNSNFVNNPALSFGATIDSVGSLSRYSNRNKVTTSDVVSAIKDLSSDIKSIKSGNITRIGNVTYDNGSSISNAVNQLVEAVVVSGRR